MAKLLKMLWEYMDLTVLPIFETWSAHIFGGWQRVCWCTNEAFNQASSTKKFWENCPQKKGGHIYGKNEGGGAKLRKWLYRRRTLDRVARVNFKREHFEISQRPNWSFRCLDFAVLPLETAVSACLLRAKQTAQVPRSSSSPGRARRTSPCPVCKFKINPQLLL